MNKSGKAAPKTPNKASKKSKSGGNEKPSSKLVVPTVENKEIIAAILEAPVEPVAVEKIDLKIAENVTELFRGIGTTPAGETVNDFRQFSDEMLESRHDYCQYMFPTVEPSAVNRSAPTITEADKKAFAEDETLRNELFQNFARILSFWDFEMKADNSTGEISFTLSDGFRSKPESAVILRSGSRFHNYLRLTRVVKSLYNLGLPAHASAFQKFLLDEVATASDAPESTIHFWRTAIPSTEMPSENKNSEGESESIEVAVGVAEIVVTSSEPEEEQQEKEVPPVANETTGEALSKESCNEMDTSNSTKDTDLSEDPDQPGIKDVDPADEDDDTKKKKDESSCEKTCTTGSCTIC